MGACLPRISWSLIILFLAIFHTTIVAQTPSSPASSISSLTDLELAQRHHTIVYALPRIGLTNDDDCFLDIYQDELERDMALIKQMGAETVFLFCPWSTETDITHTAFLNILIKYNLSFIVSLETSIYQIEKRGGEKDFQTGLYSLAWELENVEGAEALFKGVYIKYELDGETAEYFFSFVTKVSFWLKTLNYEVALMVPWVQNIGIEEKDIKAQLTQWNSAEFTAWVVLLYSPEEIQSWVNVMGTTDVQRQLFIWYGADSYDVYSNSENKTQQALQIESIYNFITLRVLDGNETIYGSAIHDFADTYYTGSGENMKYGDTSATCPDSNPFLQSSCGRTAPGVDFGDNLISREVLGLFEHYEILPMQRCIKARDAADLVRSYWNPNGDPIEAVTCTFAISNPFTFYSIFAPLGVSFLGVFLIPILCCVRRAESERQYSPRKSKTMK